MGTETRSRRRATLFLAVAMAAVMGLSTAPAPAGAAANKARIRATLKGDRWKPVHTYIGRGTRVIWINPARSNRVHDVKSIGKNWSYSKVLQPGQRVRRAFKKVGNFRFRCVRHSAMVDGKCQGMCGFIHVYRN